VTASFSLAWPPLLFGILAKLRVIEAGSAHFPTQSRRVLKGPSALVF
jgi:hypothetical protein